MTHNLTAIGCLCVIAIYLDILYQGTTHPVIAGLVIAYFAAAFIANIFHDEIARPRRSEGKL